MGNTLIEPRSLGIDCLGRPNAAATKAAGYTFVSRYLRDFSDNERDDLWSHGITLQLNDENGRGDHALQGYARGRADALNAIAQAQSFGWDFDSSILFSGTDFDVQPSQYPVCDLYAHGIWDVFGLHSWGIYGPRKYLDHLATWVPPGTVLWQAAGWRYGADSPNAYLKQRAPTITPGQIAAIGTPIDEDLVLKELVTWSSLGKVVDPNVPGFAGYAVELVNNVRTTHIVKFVVANYSAKTFWAETVGEQAAVFAMYPEGINSIPSADLSTMAKYDPTKDVPSWYVAGGGTQLTTGQGTLSFKLSP